MMNLDPNEKESLTGSVEGRVFLMVSGFLLVFLLTLILLSHLGEPTEGSKWQEAISAHLPESPRPAALSLWLEAFQQADWELLMARRFELEKAGLQGWEQNASEELEDLLRSQRPVLSSLGRAAALPPSDHPATLGRGSAAPRPPYGRIETLFLLLSTDARKNASEGHPVETLDQLLDLGRLGTHFSRPPQESTLTHHLLALSALEIASDGVLAILGRSVLTARDYSRLESELAELEDRYGTIRDGIRAEELLYGEVITSHLNDPKRLAEALLYYDPKLSTQQAAVRANELKQASLTFPQEYAKTWEALQVELVKPLWEIQLLDSAWLDEQTDNELVKLYFPEAAPLLVREGVMLTRLRLAQALCRVRRGVEIEGAAADLKDPFAPETLRTSETRLYSIGPDGIDDRGATPYVPTNGPWSGGDIVVTAKP